uniref:Uncharacterized protein n=1 Tax=Hemiselmis andersenii TaxID=464988 RepID=A0A7S0U0Y6_HEMAN
MEFPRCRRWDRDPRNELLGGLGWEYPWCSSQDWDGRNESGLRAQGHAMGAEGGRRDAGRAQGHAMGCRGEVGLGSVEPAALGLEGNAKLPLPPFFADATPAHPWHGVVDVATHSVVNVATRSVVDVATCSGRNF